MTAPPAAGRARDLEPTPDLRARLAALLPARCHAAVLPFAETVARQVAHPLGAPPASAADAAAREREVAERLGAALRAACDHAGDDGDGGGDAGQRDQALDAAARLLAADPVLLSACFQNTDLLPHHGGPAADRVALLVLRGMERLGDAEGS